jgi:phenylalanine-4-hydroxylase
MSQNRRYVAKLADLHQQVCYDESENRIWQQLINRQKPLLENRACPEFLYGLQTLNLPTTQIPQCPDVSRSLQEKTGWSLEPVNALIGFEEFFGLLAQRRFPAATFIRSLEDLDYLKEPDIFHEIFGHCPLLTHADFADFVYQIGCLGLKASASERIRLIRFYWFTVEFGLIQTDQGLRIFGGGILSSFSETKTCLENPNQLHQDFDPLTMMRTTYRYDEVQATYFVLPSMRHLLGITGAELLNLAQKAIQMGDLETKIRGKS